MPDASSPETFDVVVIGAGAAGLFCAGVAGQLGVKVLLVDHADKVAEKIRISGGGRCNFTNRELDPRAPHKHFLGANPNFCRSALARYTPADFIALVSKHGIPFHEKHKGQLFGDRSSEDFIRMLLAECGAGGVTHWQPCSVAEIAHGGEGYTLQTSRGTVHARAVVIATGGLSIPKIGATDFGYRIAKQFGIALTEVRPALVPLTLGGEEGRSLRSLSGVSLDATVACGRTSFRENILFTHRGLSGPAILQISSYWKHGETIFINLVPTVDAESFLRDRKRTRPKAELKTVLAEILPGRLAEAIALRNGDMSNVRKTNLNEMANLPDRILVSIAEHLKRWHVRPVDSEGWSKAEVTV